MIIETKPSFSQYKSNLWQQQRQEKIILVLPSNSAIFSISRRISSRKERIFPDKSFQIYVQKDIDITTHTILRKFKRVCKRKTSEDDRFPGKTGIIVPDSISSVPETRISQYVLKHSFQGSGLKMKDEDSVAQSKKENLV